MRFKENRLPWLILLLFIFLIGSLSCGRMNTTREGGAVRLSVQDTASGGQALRYQAWLFVPPPTGAAAANANDASQDTGRIYIRIVVHAFSPDADFKLISEFVERGDRRALNETFGKTERAALEYPRGGGLRERFPFAFTVSGEGERRILLFSEGGVDNVNKCWWTKIIDLKVNAQGEGDGFLYQGRVFFTPEGNLDLDRPSQYSAPSRIADVRRLK